MPIKEVLSARRLAENLLAILVTVAATGALHLLRDSLSAPVIALLYLLPVLLSATRWGLGPSILASLCAFLGFNYFFIPPYYSMQVHQTQDVLALFIFLSVAIVISQLVGQIRSSLAEAQAREHELSQLYNLSAAMVGLRSVGDVSARLANDLRASLRATAVEVTLDPGALVTPANAVSPHGSAPPATPPEHRLPLTVDRRTLGEIRLWLDRSELSPTDERLALAFAGQGAIALERALLAQSEATAKALEESDRLKSALLSSVSHVLRTPLVTIKAAASSLSSGEVPWDSAARVELLAALEEETDHLNDLVSNLLNMSRIEAGALKLDREWNILSEVVDSSVARFQRQSMTHRIEVDVPDDLPQTQIDPTLIQQVFTNLLDNSIKYAPPGTAIVVRASAKSDALIQVEVTNQGPPVADQDLESIFDRFHRVTHADRIPGTGLGLSICKGIIEAHGGRIWAENLPAGFAFKFTLPRKAARIAPDLSGETT